MRRTKLAFTLVEVLIVLSLLGLTFSILVLVFSRGVDSSLNITEGSESLKREVSLFWDLQRKIVSATRIKVEDGNLYMFTSAGSFNEGVVKCAYIYRDGMLMYYEFPYPYGAIDDVEEEDLINLGRLESFEARAIIGNRELKTYEGLPHYVWVRVNDKEFLYEIIR